MLGGLLSAYEFTCDQPEGCDAELLAKAKDVGDRLSKAFGTRTGLPYATINLQSGHGSTPGWTGGAAILAEVATVQLEFGALTFQASTDLQKPKQPTNFGLTISLGPPM